MQHPSKRSTRLADIVDAVRQGGVVAYPTEGVYGLGCNPANPEAVMRILQIKERPIEKGLILIAAELVQLDPWVEPLGTNLRKRVLASWPGPVTWLLPARRDVPVWLRGAHTTLAVRVTDHPLASALCQAVGHPLVSTSANRGGQEPARTADAVESMLGLELDGILDGPIGVLSGPTEIRDAQTGRVIRPQPDLPA